MSSVNIIRESIIEKTPRVLQLEGMFDIPPSERARHEWMVCLPLEEKPWNIGLILGPSGSGKTTIAKEIFKEKVCKEFEWSLSKSVLDGFSEKMSIKEIVVLLNSVGFSSPPSWFKPYNVLSNGEKFRITLARAIAEMEDLSVIDEFSSIVDRTAAKIGSHAIAKTTRRLNKKFIAVTCHYDVEEWLQPDWVYRPAENEFQWRFLQRRPEIVIDIRRVHHSAWKLFKAHHYLSAELNVAAKCFVAFMDYTPIAFFSYLHFVNNRLKKTKRGHRVVCLPDYQGLGIGMRLEEYIASCLKAIGFDYIGSSAHPIRNAYCTKSPNWTQLNKAFITRNKGGSGKIEAKKTKQKYYGRIVSTFRFIGPPADRAEAVKMIG